MVKSILVPDETGEKLKQKYGKLQGGIIPKFNGKFEEGGIINAPNTKDK